MSEIDALRELKDSLSYEFWDRAAYVALFAVFIGVVGEFVAQFAPWPKAGISKVKLAKASTLLLIAGLGGEIIMYAKNNAINGTIIAFLNDEAGKAYKTADEAKERAEGLALQVEQLRESNDQLEAENQSLRKDLTASTAAQTQKYKELEIRGRARDVDNDDFHRGMRDVRRDNITIIELDDVEARNFADKLVTAFRHEHFSAQTEEMKGTSSLTGVIICQRGLEGIKLVKALKRADIMAKLVPPNGPERPGFCDTPVESANSGDGIIGTVLGPKPAPPGRGVVLFVGQRPLPPQ
jgi:regulator of replication initiation timing